MARVATKLTSNRDGSFSARKRIPADVRDAYSKLYDIHAEERFNSGPAITAVLARAKEREWRSDIEARIASIRAERKGEGKTLTPKQARGLAGEWYDWYTARGLAKHRSADYWIEELSEPYDTLRQAVWGSGDWPEGREPFDDLDNDHKARAKVRPCVADRAETAQFLHTKQLLLDPASRDMFLDFVCKDFFAALELLQRRARGDYGSDKHAEQFPKFERTTDPGMTPWKLFEQWVAEAKPSPSTVDRWRGVFLKLQEAFASCAEITPDAAQTWTRGLVTAERSARTVNDTWGSAARTVFGWAKSQRLIGHNPFTEVRIKVPSKSRTREKTFTPMEIKTILSAALAISKPRTKMEAAKRWAPWLCAYTGARVGEITQLRGGDCVKEGGVVAIKLTPEAGTVKTKVARVVPLHEHLIAQGFLRFVTDNGKGPMFYNPYKTAPEVSDATNPAKPRYVRARERIAEWVRDLGITDKEVQPNHAWRHTFKQIGHRAKMTERVLDAITGHAPATEGRGYGEPSLKDKANGLKKFPRYSTGG